MIPYAALLLIGLVNAAPNRLPGSVVLLSSKIMNTTADVEPSDDLTIKANVHFVFTDDHHSIVQTSLDAPCTPLSGGFASPLDSKKGAMFSIALEDHLNGQSARVFDVTSVNSLPAEIWYACAKHCHEGEVGAIMPINTTDGNALDPENKWDMFLSNVASAQDSFSSIPQEGTPLGSGVGAHVIANPSNNGPHGFGTPSSAPSSSSSGEASSTGFTHLTKATIGGIGAGVAVFLMLVGLLIWRFRVLIKEWRHAKTKHWAVKKLVMHDAPGPQTIAGSDKPAMKEKGAAVTPV